MTACRFGLAECEGHETECLRVYVLATLMLDSGVWNIVLADVWASACVEVL